MITHVKTVSVYVADQGVALDFYVRQLGFELRRQEPMGPKGSWLEVAPPGAQTCLVLYPRALMPDWETLKPSIMLSTPDLKAEHERLMRAGVQFLQGPTRMPWGAFAKFVDPDGHEFILTQAAS